MGIDIAARQLDTTNRRALKLLLYASTDHQASGCSAWSTPRKVVCVADQRRLGRFAIAPRPAALLIELFERLRRLSAKGCDQVEKTRDFKREGIIASVRGGKMS